MGWGPVTFTVDDTLSMVAQGILPEDASIELLNGSLVYRDRFDLKGGEVVAGIEHDYVVTALSKLSAAIDNGQRHVRTQTTLVCTEKHAPIPDGMILQGNLAAYRQRLAVAADALCVIEVADSSYERDRGEKLIAYAQAAIPQYVIINLRDRTAEVYVSPDQASAAYSEPMIIAADQELQLRVGAAEYFTVKLADLLP
jgi:hypothetical protein